MGFNYRQKRKEFEQNWAKALKQYIAAGMTQEQITAMREFDEEGKELAEFLGNPKAVGDPDSAHALCLNEMLARQKEKFRQALARVQAL